MGAYSPSMPRRVARMVLGFQTIFIPSVFFNGTWIKYYKANVKGLPHKKKIDKNWLTR